MEDLLNPSGDVFIFAVMNGWVKNHRSIADWEWYKTENMAHLFQHLIREANHEDRKWQGVDVKRGQLITGRKTLSEQTGISEQSIRTCLERLKSTSEITIKVTNKFSVITICNYDNYQCNESDGNQQINQQPNQQSTSNQPATNHKQEEEEVKELKKPDKSAVLKTWKNDLETYLSECKTAFMKVYDDENFLEQQQKFNPNVDIPMTIQKAYHNFWGTEAGWQYKKSKRADSINWTLTIKNAISQSQNKVYKSKEQIERDREAQLIKTIRP